MNELMNERKSIMEKKQYNTPQIEVMPFNTVLMQLTGEASVLPGPGNAPKRRTQVF